MNPLNLDYMFAAAAADNGIGSPPPKKQRVDPFSTPQRGQMQSDAPCCVSPRTDTTPVAIKQR